MVVLLEVKSVNVQKKTYFLSKDSKINKLFIMNSLKNDACRGINYI